MSVSQNPVVGDLEKKIESTIWMLGVDSNSRKTGFAKIVKTPAIFFAVAFRDFLCYTVFYWSRAQQWRLN